MSSKTTLAEQQGTIRRRRDTRTNPQEEEFIRMALATWFADFEDKIGNLPDDYIVFDLETIIKHFFYFRLSRF